jgi:hypothetical protein
MGNTETKFANRLKSGAQDAFQAKGAQIMQLADLIYKALRGKLDGCRDHNDMPMEPAKVRAIALNAAQRYIKATV